MTLVFTSVIAMQPLCTMCVLSCSVSVDIDVVHIALVNPDFLPTLLLIGVEQIKSWMQHLTIKHCRTPRDDSENKSVKTILSSLQINNA